jgi:foldase protein PrsA
MQKKGSSFAKSKWVLVLGSLLAALLMLSACAEDEKKQDTDKVQTEETASKAVLAKDYPKVVAQYEGGEVTNEQYAKFINIMRVFNPEYEKAEQEADFDKQLIEVYVSHIDVKKKVDAKAVASIDKDVADQVTRLEQDMNSYFGENGFNKRLLEFGVTKQEITDYLKDRYYMMKYVTSIVKEESVKKKYDEQLNAGKMEKTVATVSHILLGTNEGQENARTKEQALQKAKEVLKELKAGADFAEAAKKYSDDPGSKDNGGEYADADVAEWVPEFKQAALDLPLNTLSEPVETSYGYHIMKVTKRGPKTTSYDESKEELRNELSQKAYEDYIQKTIRATIKNVKLK